MGTRYAIESLTQWQLVDRNNGQTSSVGHPNSPGHEAILGY